MSSHQIRNNWNTEALNTFSAFYLWRSPERLPLTEFILQFSGFLKFRSRWPFKRHDFAESLGIFHLKSWLTLYLPSLFQSASEFQIPTGRYETCGAWRRERPGFADDFFIFPWLNPPWLGNLLVSRPLFDSTNHGWTRSNLADPTAFPSSPPLCQRTAPAPFLFLACFSWVLTLEEVCLRC